MFEQLCACLLAHRQPTEQQRGRVCDQLRRIAYFNDLSSSFGSDYLLIMVPLLEPFLLRQGLSLLGQNDQYVLLDGNLREVEVQFEADRTIEQHRVLDLRDKASVRYTADSDCQLIRIRRAASSALLHFQKRLLQKERQRNQQMAKLRKLIKLKDHKNKLGFLQQMEFFCTLGQFDLLDLTVQSRVQEYAQGNTTHCLGEEVDAIGCVLSGKAKLTFSAREARGHVCVQIGEGEWIGLQQYLWEGNFRSSGEAASVSATILWVPRAVFSSKFSLSANYQTMSRLIGLVEAKKALFDRSLDCRRRKEAELFNESEALKQMNAQLLQKIAAMTVQQRRKDNFRKAKPVQEMGLPSTLLHRSNLVNDNNPPALLPKLCERVNLFPEEFQQTAISIAQLREMQRLAEIVKNQHKDHLQREKEGHRTIEQNPEGIYKSILTHIPKDSRACTVDRFSQTMRQSRTSRFRTHSNFSIYNNFRVRSRPKETFCKSKTLSILP